PPAVDLEALGSLSWIKELQAESESNQEPSVILSLDGMTCVGCAWLVEKVSYGQSGVKLARVDLEASTVGIKWIPNSFSLADVVIELSRFGYRASRFEDVRSSRISPLLWRICLTSLFAVNGALLAVFPSLAGGGSEYGGLIQLLEWFVAGLSAFVGATFFMLPAYQSLRRFRLHYDAVPALALVVGYLSATLGAGDLELWHVSSLLTVLLVIRWVQRWQWSLVMLPAGDVDSKVLLVLQIMITGILIFGAYSLFTHDAGTVIAVLVACSLYPLARCVSHVPSLGFVLFSIVCAFIGVALGYMSGSILLALLYLLSTGVISNFLFFRYPQFCSKQ
ncbi:MAG: cation transporter, partial [Lentimonas sp.]